MSYEDQINLSSKVAEGITLLLNQDFNCVEIPERMAWIVYLLKEAPDTEEYFPMGKWATIQAIEFQLKRYAKIEMEAQEVVK